MEYPVVGFHDGKIRWVRGLGTVQHDSTGKNTYFTGVLHEISERKKDELRKNDFISMASHELKTPLTSLSAIMQTLKLQFEDAPDEFTAKTLDRAYAQVKKMDAMINGFLNASYFGTGKIYLNLQTFDLTDLMLATVEETTLTSPYHSISYLPDTPLLISADPDKIGSVVSNLLSNAVKYSPKGSSIEVGSHVANDQVIVSVKDQGIGINPVDIGKIFDRFYRVVNGATQSVTGFGIGLYLSSEIIVRHGGNIWVASQVGAVSTFFFSLPL
jgi:signal transduction histidine kinase